VLQASDLAPPAFSGRLHDTRLETPHVLLGPVPVDLGPVHSSVRSRTRSFGTCHWSACPSCSRHLSCPLWRFAKLSRDEAPRGSQPAFAARRYRLRTQPLSGPLQAGLRYLRDPKPTALSARLTARFPQEGGRWAFHVPRTYLADGLGPDFPPVTTLSAAGHRQIPAPGHSPFGSSLLPC